MSTWAQIYRSKKLQRKTKLNNPLSKETKKLTQSDKGHSNFIINDDNYSDVRPLTSNYFEDYPVTQSR